MGRVPLFGVGRTREGNKFPWKPSVAERKYDARQRDRPSVFNLRLPNLGSFDYFRSLQRQPVGAKMRARLLLSVSVAALLWASTSNAQQLDPQTEQQFASQYALSAGDLTAPTVQLLKEKLSAEQKLQDAQNSVASAQANIDSTARQLSDAQSEQTKKYQAMIDAGIKVVTLPDGKITTDAQAAREKAIRQANDLANQAKTTYREALIDLEMSQKNPGAYSPQQRAEIASRLKNAFEHQTQAEQTAIHAAEQIDRQALALLQDYNGALDKTKSAATANEQAKSALSTATNAVKVNKATAQDVDVLLKTKAIADSDAKKARNDVARTAAAAGRFPPVSVLGTVGGATQLNAINLANTLANGTIKVSDLTPEQKSALVNLGGANIVAQGAGNIRIADLTPAMLLGIVAQGGGNIVAQGAGNIVAQGGGNLAQLAAAIGIISNDGASIISTDGASLRGGGIVAQGAGNLSQLAAATVANLKQAETSLLTVGLANSIISNDGASLIGRQVAQGIISNDGASLISNDGGSLISNDGGSIQGKSPAQLAASASSLIDNAKVAALISPNGGSLISPNGGTIISGNGSALISPNGAAIISTGGAGIISTGGAGASNTNAGIISGNGSALIAPNGGTLIAPNGGNLIAPNGGTLIAPNGGTLISPNGAGVRAFQGSSDSPSPSQNNAPAQTPGGGFRQNSTISVTGSYVDQKTGNIISTNSNDRPASVASAAATQPVNQPASAPVTSMPPVSASGRPYDPNDWTTWPQKDVHEFMRPGITVEQFKASAEKDLAAYKHGLEALATHATLTPTQQSQKAGSEAQIRSLEFQIEAANRALGLPTNAPTTTARTADTTAPASPAPAVPVMSAAAIAATVPLKTNLAEAQSQVTNRMQQIASANQGLADLQAQRTKTTDPAALKGIDAAISSAKFQIDVMQQSLDRENKQIATLQSSAPSAPAEPVKLSTEQNASIQKSLRTIPGKLSAPEKHQFDNLSTLAQRAASKGVTATDAAALKSGIATLLARHPQAAKRYHLDRVSTAVNGSAAVGNAHRTALPPRPQTATPVAPTTPNAAPPGAVPGVHNVTPTVHTAAPPVQPPHTVASPNGKPPATPKIDQPKPHPVHASAPHPAKPEPPHRMTAPVGAPHRKPPEIAKPVAPKAVAPKAVAPKPVAVARPAVVAPRPVAPKPVVVAPKPVVPVAPPVMPRR